MALFPKVGRTQPRLRVAWWVMVVFLCLGVLLHLFPFYFMIITSFKPALETMAMPPTFWPQHPTTAGWQLVMKMASFNPSMAEETGVQALLDYQPFYVYFLNSLFMTGMTLAISLPVTSLAAYANSKLQRGPIARWSFLFFIGTLMVPNAVTLVPRLFLTLNFPFALPTVPHMPGTSSPFPTFRTWDSPWAVILPSVFSAFNFLLFKGFFDTIPNSIIQAARVDGGSEFNIFRRIVLPMSVPVYAVAAWVLFSGVWDSFLWPVVVFRSPEKLPMSVAIYQIMNIFAGAGTTNRSALGASGPMRDLLNAGLSWDGLMVLGLLQTFPIFVMFIICREYLMRGIRLRGLK